MYDNKWNRTDYKIPENNKLKWIEWDIQEDPKNKLPFCKFSNKLHML